jgi:glycosyltransferase involved in cell wall biosynthesis
MISLAVCSINNIALQALKQNFDKNIGVEHEWLIWENKDARLGLCTVYNALAEKAKYQYICFVHEDVQIETPSWGRLLIDVCEKDNVALIGVAGGKYKSNLFSGWYSGGKGMDYYAIIHRVNGKDERIYAPVKWEKPEIEVATIDGVFMFCKKSIWAQTRFNSELLKGFHYYDIDFSLRVALLNKVVVTERLELIHHSTGGDFGDNWVNDTFVFHDALQKHLPFTVSADVQKDIHVVAAKYWLDWLKNMNISMSNRIKWVQLQGLYKYEELWYSILKFMLYRPLALKRIHRFFKSKKLPLDN